MTLAETAPVRLPETDRCPQLSRFLRRHRDISIIAPPGVSMKESDRIAGRIGDMLLEVPEVTHVSRRTGRAELDEHAENVNFSEVDVGLIQPEQPKPGIHYEILRAIPGLRRYGVEEVGRSRDEVMAEIGEA